jgi:hypothetical protein
MATITSYTSQNKISLGLIAIDPQRYITHNITRRAYNHKN